MKGLIEAGGALIAALAALLVAVGGIFEWAKRKGKAGASADAPVNRFPSGKLIVSGVSVLVILLVIFVVLLVAGVLGRSPATVSGQNLDSLKREVAGLTKSVDELQTKSENLKATIEASNTKISELETRAKVLEATVEPSNIEIGELEMRARALETTVAGVDTAAKNLPLSVEKARNQLPSESVLLDSYIALIGQSKENAVALRSLERETLLFGGVILLFVILGALYSWSVYRQQTQDARMQDRRMGEFRHEQKVYMDFLRDMDRSIREKDRGIDFSESMTAQAYKTPPDRPSPRSSGPIDESSTYRQP